MNRIELESAIKTQKAISNAEFEKLVALEDEYKRYEESDLEQYVGKCYKYKNNYSCPETEDDYWYVYVKILSVKDHRNLNAVTFFTQKVWCRSACVNLETIGSYSLHPQSEYKQITTTEFEKEFDKVLGEIAIRRHL